MNATERLTELFMRFPGIGPKQAKRFVYYLLREHSHFKEQLISALEELKFTGRQCDVCFRYFGDKSAVQDATCSICKDETRNRKTVMIIEKELDLDAIEKTASYAGIYFILGGLIPPLTEKPSELIRIRELVAMLHQKISNNDIEEIIFALPVTDNGDVTREYVEKTVKQIVGIGKVKLSTLARGLSSGLELEYVDKNTFKNAFEHRG
ncbi:MAG: recombination protein RecR [Patescibacteria group bacterium]|nr:recombination protein RecR [Patescibacteria group bacterium]